MTEFVLLGAEVLLENFSYEFEINLCVYSGHSESKRMEMSGGWTQGD